MHGPAKAKIAVSQQPPRKHNAVAENEKGNQEEEYKSFDQQSLVSEENVFFTRATKSHKKQRERTAR